VRGQILGGDNINNLIQVPTSIEWLGSEDRWGRGEEEDEE